MVDRRLLEKGSPAGEGLAIVTFSPGVCEGDELLFVRS